MKARVHKRRDPRLIAGIAMALLLAGLSYLAVTAERGLPFRSYYALHLQVRDAGEIDDYSDVRIAGKLIGQVLGSSYGDGIANLNVQFYPGNAPLRAGSSARIRLQGLLGAKYVELYPSRSGRILTSGTTIPVSQTSTTVSVFQVLETFDAKRRADLRSVLGALGEGFLARGDQLNAALGNAPGLIRDIGELSQAVASEPTAAKRFVPATQSLTAAFDPVRGDLAAGFGPEAQALQPLVTERPFIQETLAEAPGALGAIQRGLALTDPLLAQTAGFARAAVRLTAPAPAALRAATGLLQASPEPLRQTRALLADLARAIPPTLQLTGNLNPLLAPTARVLNNTIPILNSLGARRCDLLGMWRNWRSLLSFGTPNGSALGAVNVVRVGVVAGADNLTSGLPKPPSLVGSDTYAPPCSEVLEHLP